MYVLLVYELNGDKYELVQVFGPFDGWQRAKAFRERISGDKFEVMEVSQP